ncbi:unnamed protein product [Cylicostephanus goldi]|uniref:Uncharacterized protein n=1 Tax=Cylicostephanus goldi TaxID=71465 RepID=A0A3P7Q2G1_CYLGO|nr:unnamed protein product [Cylicostephanus goldi]
MSYSLDHGLGSWGGVGSALIRQGGVAVSCSVHASLALTHDGPLMTSEIEACSSITQMEINDVTDLLNRLFENEALFPRKTLIIKGTEETIPMTWELTFRIQKAPLDLATFPVAITFYIFRSAKQDKVSYMFIIAIIFFCTPSIYYRLSLRMSTEVEDILKNAQTTAAKQSMFAEDLENLSLLEDSRDSFLTALDDSQPG